MAKVGAARHETITGWLGDFTFAAEMLAMTSTDSAAAVVASLRSGMVAMGKVWERDPAIGAALLASVEAMRGQPVEHGDGLVTTLIADWDMAGE